MPAVTRSNLGQDRGRTDPVKVDAGSSGRNIDRYPFESLASFEYGTIRFFSFVSRQPTASSRLPLLGVFLRASVVKSVSRRRSDETALVFLASVRRIDSRHWSDQVPLEGGVSTVWNIPPKRPL